MTQISIGQEIILKILELAPKEVYAINGNEIITVVSGAVRDATGTTLEEFCSSCFYAGNTLQALEETIITIVCVANADIFLGKIDVDAHFGDFCRTHWDGLRQLWDVPGFEKVDLYRSKQVFVTHNAVKYGLNFWFCGKEVDCLFHNQHNFVETHTNIAGDGYMQKSRTNHEDGLCETVGLLPGNSHRTFNIPGEFEANGDPKYPFHRWLGGTTGNVWLAIEKYS